MPRITKRQISNLWVWGSPALLGVPLVHEDRLPCKGSPRKTKSSSWVNHFLENTIKNYLFQSASQSYQSVLLKGLRSQSILFNDWWNVPRGQWSTFPKVFRFEFVVPRTLIANASRSVTLDPLHDEISFTFFHHGSHWVINARFFCYWVPCVLDSTFYRVPRVIAWYHVYSDTYPAGMLFYRLGVEAYLIPILFRVFHSM